MSAKILVVDDSASDRLVIKKILREYDVMTACDGLEAMSLIDKHEDIDLIVLDLHMPVMDGFEVLAALKSDDRYKKLRTIVLTNYGDLDNEIKGLELGAVDYISKPVSTSSLKVRVEIHLELLRMQQLLEEKLYEQKSTFDTIFNQASIGIAISHDSDPFDTNSNLDTQINPMFEKITGRTKEELIKLGWAKITHPDDLREDMRNYRKYQSGETNVYSTEKRYVKPDGSIVWVQMTVAPFTLSGGRRNSQIALVQDITQRKTAENDLLESERRKSVLPSHMPGMAYKCNYDRDWTMQYISAGCLELTGYTPESLINNRDLSFNDLIAPEYREPIWREFRNSLANQSSFKYEYQIITAKGERKWVLEMREGIFDEQGTVEAVEGIIIDISDRKEFENTLRFNYEHDSWTGLHNRNYLEAVMESDARNQTAQKKAVVGINLSAVNLLNTTYGFHYTQKLIRLIADALGQYCTDNRILFSTHEKLFIFYLSNYKDKKELVEFSDAVSKTLRSILAVERIGGGIGVIEMNDAKDQDVDQLLKNLLMTSERAINIDKRDIGICFYDEGIELLRVREQEINDALEKFVADEKNGGFFLQYQPILDLETDKIVGYESLARLNIDGIGPVTPLEFIPIAEKTKLILPIGRQIILESFRFLNKLKKNGHDTVAVSINVSAIQLLSAGFAEDLFEMMEQMKIRPENVGLEITESVFASDFEEINGVLAELKDSGIHIAIDDFGTGYSSLSRERDLNVNCLKIDKSFIDRLMYLTAKEAITGSIISMAHKLGHYVIAEGVEHEKQRRYLKKSKCDRMQGYIVSKPLDEEAAIEFLKTYNH